MSALDNAIETINTAASRTTKTTEFIDQWSTFDDQSDVTNPNNNVSVPSAQKKVKQTLDSYGITVDSAQAAADAAANSAVVAASAAAYAQSIAEVTGGRVRARIDSNGNTQIVVRIPLLSYETLNIPGCPFTGALDAFRKADGTLRTYVDICMHEAANYNATGNAVSQAGLDPYTSVTTDASRSKCTVLGTGWKMAGAYERSLLGWIMLSNDFQPRGNTQYGRAYNTINEVGLRQDGLLPNDTSGTARVLTGSGPDAWRHDGTAFGISNFVGNVWERDDGWKMINGQFYVSEYLGQSEAEWIATGCYITTGGVLTNTAPATTISGNITWGDITKDASYVENELLQRLLIDPIDCTKSLKGSFYYNTDGECLPVRGGSWSIAANAGPAALNCNNPRSYAGGNIGFRAAYSED